MSTARESRRDGADNCLSRNTSTAPFSDRPPHTAHPDNHLLSTLPPTRLPLPRCPPGRSTTTISLAAQMKARRLPCLLCPPISTRINTNQLLITRILSLLLAHTSCSQISLKTCVTPLDPSLLPLIVFPSCRWPARWTNRSILLPSNHHHPPALPLFPNPCSTPRTCPLSPHRRNHHPTRLT